MKFRIGLFIGLVIGFLAGARAGRDRYDQIVSVLRKARSNEQVREATAIAEEKTRKPRAAAGRGLVSAADTMRAKASR